MVKLTFAIFALIVLTMAGGAWVGFDPSWPVLAILAFGIFMVGRIGGPPLPRGDRPTHWETGHGIYFDSDDVWVSGSGDDREDPNDADRFRR